jgi:hypothetical protein
MNTAITANAASATPAVEEFRESSEESGLKPILEKLSTGQKDKFLQFFRERRTERRKMLLQMGAAAVPISPQRDDSIAIERHRKLATGEQPMPTRTVVKVNPEQIERGNMIFEALQFATGSRNAALDVLRQMGPLPQGIQ